MFGHIVVAYDGSDRAQDALVLALRLRHRDGQLTLACALPGAAAPEVSEDVAIMLAAGRAQVPLGIHVALRAPLSSSPAQALTELAEAEHADLVVVGSSRRIADGRIRLERTAGRLLQSAPCAVAVAPAGLRDEGPFRHVGIAFDGTPEARTALAAGYAIAAARGSAATVLHAHATPSAPPDVLDEAADAAPARMSPRTLLLHGPPATVIAEACEGVVDLLVCGSRGYGPIERALMGSVAEGLVEGAPHPVLVLPRKAAPVVSDRRPDAATVEA